MSAGFELQGTPETGHLVLNSPLGNTLGVLRWSPGEALLESSGEIKRFSSVEALLEKTTGAAIPLPALFDWLNGKNTAVNGWTADVSQRAKGRITAVRTEPAPQTDLRIALDQ